MDQIAFTDRMMFLLTDDLLLSDEQSKLILTGFVELTELDAFDLGTDVGTEVVHFGTFQERQRRVGIFSMFIMLEHLERRVGGVLPYWKIVRVLSWSMFTDTL